MSRSKSIKISKKYGVNPSIPLCFWCGKEKQEIALLGKISDHDCSDIEAPRNIILDYEPCDNCKKKFELGIVFIEVSQTPNYKMQPCIQTNSDGSKLYPTSRYAIMTEKSVRRIFSEEKNKALFEKRKAYIEKEVYEAMFLTDPKDKDKEE